MDGTGRQSIAHVQRILDQVWSPVFERGSFRTGAVVVKVLRSTYMKLYFYVSIRNYLQFDLASIPWGDDPGPVIASLQSMVSAPEMVNTSLGSSTSSINERLDNLKSPIQNSTK